jgi:hypothetical protein
MALARSNTERVNVSLDLIDPAGTPSFIRARRKDFGARVRME